MVGTTIPMKVLVQGVDELSAIKGMLSAAECRNTNDLTEFQILLVNDDNTYTSVAEKRNGEITFGEHTCCRIADVSIVPDEQEVKPVVESYFAEPGYDVAA
jgi:hypothetical protein